MIFVIGDRDWSVEVLTTDLVSNAANNSCGFTLNCRAETSDLCREGLEAVFSLLGAGREVYWRTHPEVELWKDLATTKSGWTGYARFSVRTIGTIEHEPKVYPDDEVVYLGLGILKEGA